MTPLGELIEQYRQWLVGDRGLAPLTVARYVALASRFLGERMSAVDELGVKDLDGRHVAAFLLRECERLSVDSAKGKVGELRSMLRFCSCAGSPGWRWVTPSRRSPAGGTQGFRARSHVRMSSG